ncbi:hypothetical protein PanWU01x14_249290 [Parasponia andersonii]|uniref:DUF3741 domain-containing protein n=1 Tax=Parasponia andersonii TaxID=3476 RepID=A0A2P5BDA4_PARAD|nr:hypothetical protein PanWU01x14_249290 [Parasponia andersonii]
MKRQDSLPSSSSHRENKNNNNNATEKLHAKAVGCMSGLFDFVSGYRSRRKFLTFGKRHEKHEPATNSTNNSNGKSSTTRSSSIDKEGIINTTGSTNVLQRYSCEVPRSPTLPAEIRRSNSVNSPQNFCTPPALVARLMGLEEAHSTMSKAMHELPEFSSAAEKRRQLLGALEKCDQDLKALKKIIDAVRSAEGLQSPATAVFGTLEGYQDDRVNNGWNRFHGVKGLEVNKAEQPSPVSVLDEFTRFPLSNLYHSKRQSFSYGRMQHQVKQPKKKPGEADLSPSIFDRITCESLHRKASIISTDLHHLDISTLSSPSSSPSSSPLWSSQAMKESVEEVCKDIAWGERREIGRIGLALQDHICRDLIEEIVTDLTSFHCHNNLYSSLPFEACKRRLCF